MSDLDQQIRDEITKHGVGASMLRNALRDVLDEHPPTVSTAGIYAEKFGKGRCAHCGKSPLIREYRGHLNGRARTQWMHDHVDLHPICPTCHSRTEYEAMQDWPCDTVRAIARALGITEEATRG